MDRKKKNEKVGFRASELNLSNVINKRFLVHASIGGYIKGAIIVSVTAFPDKKEIIF